MLTYMEMLLVNEYNMDINTDLAGRKCLANITFHKNITFLASHEDRILKPKIIDEYIMSIYCHNLK